ncbi:MAG: sugar ABC transporter substrate-binding protein, partial [Clostridiales bacterium]|nr:sugar ABC transporter substrate-binding protein [Clostridiales bacterium]
MIKITKYHVLLALMAFFIIGAGILIFLNFRSSMSGIDGNTEIITHDSKPEYHFVLISENISDPFWKSLKKGVERASGEFDVAVEFVGPSFLDRDEEKKYFKIAVASRVDGIATHVWNEEEAQLLIDKAVDKGIPVVAIDSDAGKSRRSAFVGASAYDSGLKLGRMLVEASNGKASAAVLVNSESEDTTVQNLILSGINDAVVESPEVRISIIDIMGKNYTGVEDAAGEVLSSRPDLDFIVCTT